MAPALGGEGVGEWRELTQMVQAGSLLLQAPPRLSIPLTRRKLLIPLHSEAKPEPDDEPLMGMGCRASNALGFCLQSLGPVQVLAHRHTGLPEGMKMKPQTVYPPPPTLPQGLHSAQ